MRFNLRNRPRLPGFWGLWIIGKDAGWLMTMGLVFITTFALSFFAPSSRP